MVIHSTENASLLYLKRKEMLYATLVGFNQSDEVYSMAKNIKANITNLKGTKCIVADTTKLEVLGKSDFDIIVNSIMPTLRTINISKVAFIKPLNAFGQNNVFKFMKNIKVSEARVFDTIESAEKWLVA